MLYQIISDQGIIINVVRLEIGKDKVCDSGKTHLRLEKKKKNSKFRKNIPLKKKLNLEIKRRNTKFASFLNLAHSPKGGMLTYFTNY